MGHYIVPTEMCEVHRRGLAKVSGATLDGAMPIAPCYLVLYVIIASATEKHRQRLIEAGTRVVVFKPFGVEEPSRVLREMLRLAPLDIAPPNIAPLDIAESDIAELYTTQGVRS